MGERVTANQIIADGPSCSGGEIALGKNVLIGFVTWEGYNYEDAILLNERLSFMIRAREFLSPIKRKTAKA